MKTTAGSMKKRSYTVFWVLLLFVVSSLCITLSLLISPFWLILLPFSIFIIFILQLMSRFFWLEKNNCPRCNAQVSKYSETCRNCGLKLWFKCLSCGTYLRVDTKFCEKCNMELRHSSEEIKGFEEKSLASKVNLTESPNYCSNCGAEVREGEKIKFCEKCGESLQ